MLFRFLPLLTQFVNALESIATYRDESLTGSRSQKIKKYSIDIEPDSENMQVSDREFSFTAVVCEICMLSS